MLALSKQTGPPENSETPKRVVPGFVQLGICFAEHSLRREDDLGAVFAEELHWIITRKNRRVNSAQRRPGRISIFRRTGASAGFQAR